MTWNDMNWHEWTWCDMNDNELIWHEFECSNFFGFQNDWNWKVWDDDDDDDDDD